MNDIAPPVSGNTQPQRNVTTVVYALQAASFVLGITFFIAPVVNYLKRASVAGTWLESHFRWQLNTFWYGLTWVVAGALCLSFGLFGVILLTSGVIWIVFRIVQGWVRLSMNQPMRC